MVFPRHPLFGVESNDLVVSGAFRPNGATGIVSSSGKGAGFSVARAGVGLYTLTFDEPLGTLKSFQASARDADGQPVIVQFGDYDSDSKTLQMRVFKRAQAGDAKGTIPLDITSLREIAANDIQALAAHGGLLASDSDPALARVDGATDKALRAIWDTTNDIIEVQFPPVPIPEDLDDSEDVTVHLMAAMESTNDTPAIDVQAFAGVGDTEMGGATAALSDTLAEVSVTLDAANIPAHPNFLNIALVPGAHETDALYLYAAWIEYTRKAALELTDLASDADNEVSFALVVGSDTERHG